MSRGLPFVIALTLLGCGDRERREIVKRTPLETEIARDLTARFSTPVTTTCAVVAGIPSRCEAKLADGTNVPIAITSEANEWAWRIDGLAIETAPIVERVTAMLADLRQPQPVNCGGRVRFVARDERITCKLGGGGMAFVQVAADGSTSFELALDAASAAARSELVTPERSQQLEKMSRDLESLEGESDEDEEVPVDGGVPKP